MYSFFTLLTIVFSVICLKLPAEKISHFTTIYGSETISEPLIQDLIASDAMQRLKSIDQSGISHYVGKIKAYSRYEHSIGVYQLLKRFQASLPEQAAGLLHDASHTVFSHVGDWLFFQGSHDHSYQDGIHSWYLTRQGIDHLVQNYGMSLQEVLVKGNSYLALDQELPDICADRLEYNLYTGVLMGQIKLDDVNLILEDLHYQEGKWYFEDPAIAARFAKLSLYFTENFWAASWNMVINEIFARALRRSLDLSQIDMNEIHFGSDERVLNKLKTSDDQIIRDLMHKCEEVEKHFIFCAPEEADYYCKGKFRGIDPLVKINHQFVRLTSIDENFAKYFNNVKECVSKGIYVKIY